MQKAHPASGWQKLKHSNRAKDQQILNQTFNMKLTDDKRPADSEQNLQHEVTEDQQILNKTFKMKLTEDQQIRN